MMPENVISPAAPKVMSDRLFEKISQFIYSECGIKLIPIKKAMLQSRLRKRLKACEISSFEKYYDYLISSQGMAKELVHALDAVSTNKTDFFREESHFDYLRTVSLPQIIQSIRMSSRKIIYIWSAGCSSGEEPYTLAMVLNDCLRNYPGFNYEILGTDISQRMLIQAERAIYGDQDIHPIPPSFRNKYLMKGKGAQKGNWRIVSDLRDRIRFKRLNLMDDHFDLPNPMDIIFCRNVIIYFDRSTQIRLFKKFFHYLGKGGFLFIGHSETLYGINDQFKYLQASVYRKPL